MKKAKYFPYLMWLIPLSFFTYQFVLRLWPGLMMNQIMERLAINASSFGVISASYYYGYALLQIPIAYLLERFPEKKILFFAAALCGIANLIFCFTNNWYLACLCRFLVGSASAAGFLGVSKIVTLWFSKAKYSKMIGYSFTIGLTGAIYAGKPVNLLVNNYGVDMIAVFLSIIPILIAFLSLIFLQSPDGKQNNSKDIGFDFKDIFSLIKSPKIIFLGLGSLLMVGSLEGFADVWGISYLMKAYNLDKGEAASLIAFIFIGMLFGGPILASLAQKLGNYHVIAICGIIMFCSLIMILFSSYNLFYFACLLFIIGISCCYQVLIFAAGSELVSPKMLGISIAFLNCINMLGGSFFHTFIGLVMDIFWQGDFDANNLKIYHHSCYKNSILIVPFSALIGSIIIYLISSKTKKIYR